MGKGSRSVSFVGGGPLLGGFFIGGFTVLRYTYCVMLYSETYLDSPYLCIKDTISVLRLLQFHLKPPHMRLYMCP